MTSQEIFETYKKAEILDIKDFILIFFAIILVAAAISWLGKGDFQEIIINSILFSIVITLFITILVNYINNERIDEWGEKIETQYIEKLPLEKDKILDYVVTSDYLLEENSNFFTKEKHGNLKPTKISIVKITYLSDGIKKERTVNAKIERDKSIKEPYIEYQYLENNLPYDIEVSKYTVFLKGFYNTTLYIPEQYEAK
jgi:hypothetical protein